MKRTAVSASTIRGPIAAPNAVNTETVVATSRRIAPHALLRHSPMAEIGWSNNPTNNAVIGTSGFNKVRTA
jgi:hypothetical protein